MGSIINRDGKWRAQIRRKGHPNQCKTFPTKAQAERWVRQRESDMDNGGEPVQGSTLTVSELVKAYRDLRDRARPISDASNEHYMLKSLERGLGDKIAARLTPDDMVGFATMRREEGAGPYTINMDVSKLGTVMRYGGAAARVSLPDVVGSARPLLTHLRLIGGGGKRERRPTDDELRAILAHLTETRGIKFAEAVAFAAITAMRRGEVCDIQRADMDEKTRTVQVWRKHPRLGKTLEKVPLLGESWDIAMRQPKHEHGRVFDVYASTLSKYFTWACRDLGIPDLHLHDMRHEGTSRLFEQGWEIQQVALVTGHKSWANLRRYTNLRPEDMHAQSPNPRSSAPRRSTKPRP